MDGSTLNEWFVPYDCLCGRIVETHGRASLRANQPNQPNQTVNQSQFYRQPKLIIFIHLALVCLTSAF